MPVAASDPATRTPARRAWRGTEARDAWKIGAGMEPDDAAEGEAMLQEAGDEGELR